MKVVPVRAREDNYMYLLIDDTSSAKPYPAAAIDPYDVPKLSDEAGKLGVNIVAALTTHHHYDHSGGNEAFAKKYPGLPIYGGSDKVPALTKLVKNDDEFTVGENIRVKCLATPCHTLDSICYHATSSSSSSSHPGGVFTGDTLFIAGCGRFFEGTPAQMHSSLSLLSSALPAETIVYNGHEYTRASLAFALSVDSENDGLKRLKALVDEKAKGDGWTTGLSTIADEKEWNVFMRLWSPPVRDATQVKPDTPDEEVMEKLRELKNAFRG